MNDEILSKGTNSREVETAVYKTLLESTKAIPWKIEWRTMRFAYIGPQIEALLGWTPESWTSAQDWSDRMHPDDRQWVVDFCVSQSKAGVDHEADYRALTKDGSYVWIRDVVHVVRSEDGTVEALVGFMFDISERKRSEDRVLQLQRDLEAMTARDGLTGVANRTRFDALFGLEWESAQKQQRPLSVLLIDLDHFKAYNAHYGSAQGDECLRRVAQILGAVGAIGTRPRDLFARFGGDQLVLLLPETDEAGAASVAARCLSTLAEAAIPHVESGIEGRVTVSIGAWTNVPMPGDGSAAFLDEVTARLARAKAAGRNTLVSSKG